MEKLRPIDGKLQHQIDRLIKLSSLDHSSQEAVAARLRPNPRGLMGNDDDDDDDESEEGNGEDDDDDEGDSRARERVSDSDEDDEVKNDPRRSHITKTYKAPKMMSMDYKVCHPFIHSSTHPTNPTFYIDKCVYL